MKEYLKKNGIRIGVIVIAVAIIIAFSSAARSGEISFLQNATGVLEAPIKKVLSSTVNWFDTIYGYLYKYDSLQAENESLRSQLADVYRVKPVDRGSPRATASPPLRRTPASESF